MKESDYLKVSSWLKQGYEYKKSYAKVDVHTKPLLMYYCFLNITKAILAIIQDKLPDKNFHGIKSPKICKDFLEVKIEANDGIFLELCKINGDKIIKNDTLSVSQMFENFLEMNYYYSDYFGVKNNFIKATVNVFMNGEIEIYINDELKKYKELFDGYEIKQKDNIDYYYTKIICVNNNDFPICKNFSDIFDFKVIQDGNYYLNTNSNKISQISSIYGLIFILGSIVRYHPEYLYKITNQNDGILQFLTKTLETSNRVYPNLLINMLSGKRNIFTNNYINL